MAYNEVVPITWPIPEIGSETAQMVLNHISNKPQAHNQSSWEEGHGCQTQRCVGGWAQFFHEGTVTFNTDPDDDSNHVSYKARKYLGIDQHDADRLFWNTTDEQAKRALEFLAAGQPIDWNVVYEEDDYNDDDEY